MKAVILAGGLGTRLSEETAVRPKPMVEVGGKPILWHIMKIYSAHGISDFIICCGYKGYVIKEFFANYLLHTSDVTFDVKRNTMEIHKSEAEEWRVTLIDTGDATMTGGRIKKISEYIENETFCMTYGDGVSDVNINELIAFHRTQGTYATLTAVQPAGRFGAFTLSYSSAKVDHFREKPKGDDAWINGGFFVLEPNSIEYIKNDATVWEQEPLSRLAQEGMLSAFKHEGFWQSMDTLRDKNVLEELWHSGKAPWRVW
jgi:glucose-1-phosphate cytidylyltransferase